MVLDTGGESVVDVAPEVAVVDVDGGVVPVKLSGDEVNREDRLSFLTLAELLESLGDHVSEWRVRSSLLGSRGGGLLGGSGGSLLDSGLRLGGSLRLGSGGPLRSGLLGRALGSCALLSSSLLWRCTLLGSHGLFIYLPAPQ